MGCGNELQPETRQRIILRHVQSLSDTDYGTTHMAVLAPNGDAASRNNHNQQEVSLELLVSYKSINKSRFFTSQLEVHDNLVQKDQLCATALLNIK